VEENSKMAVVEASGDWWVMMMVIDGSDGGMMEE